MNSKEQSKYVRIIRNSFALDNENLLKNCVRTTKFEYVINSMSFIIIGPPIARASCTSPVALWSHMTRKD